MRTGKVGEPQGRAQQDLRLRSEPGVWGAKASVAPQGKIIRFWILSFMLALIGLMALKVR